jgi:BCD family chlorophyll transporter-like MFS transporter
MMVTGFIGTTAAAGFALEPFSGARLVAVSATISVIALVLTLAGVWNIEGETAPAVNRADEVSPHKSFREELAGIWSETQSRRFAIFILISMLAYSAPDLILEPFAGAVFGMTPGETTRLAGYQHTGTMIGMILVPLLHRLVPAWRTRTIPWIVFGCIVCAFGLLNISAAAIAGPGWPLRASFLAMGITTGIFSIAAISAMMNLASAGHRDREGTRMGLWGAAQAIAYATGGFLGTLLSDAARHVLPSVSLSYALVFAAEAGLFIFAACLAIWIGKPMLANAPAEETPWAAKQEV